MYPFLLHFSFGNHAIILGAYSLFLLLAAVTGIIGSWLFAKKRGFPSAKVLATLLIMLLAALIGARLWHIMDNFGVYHNHPEKLFEIVPTGFSLYGGMFFAILSGLIMTKVLKLDSYQLGDTITPFLGISIAILRIGCFLNGCCFGQESNLPWAVTFPLWSPAHIHQIDTDGSFFSVQPVHPTQLYEMVAALILSTLAFWMLYKRYPKGMTMLVFITGFSLFRFFNNFLRVNPDTLSVPTVFYPLLYLIITIIGIVLINRIRKNHALL